MSGVEPNPGPQFHMGMLSAHSVMRKDTLIQVLEMITSHRLDALAICETWICADDLDTIKLDSAPVGFSVMHVPPPISDSSESKRGLCFIHHDELFVKQHPLQRSMKQQIFEYQIMSISNSTLDRPADKPIVLANIYRPPSSTIPSEFLRRNVRPTVNGWRLHRWGYIGSSCVAISTVLARTQLWTQN